MINETTAAAELQELKMEELLALRGESVSCTSGISMWPMLRHRKDTAVIVPVTRPLKKYDVPLYRLDSGKLVLHRILKVTDKGYVIRGDNLLHKEYIPLYRPDGDYTDLQAPFRGGRVIGVLKSFYRKGKHVDCEKSRGYRVYIRINRWSYPFRALWLTVLRRPVRFAGHLVKQALRKIGLLPPLPAK